MESIRTAMLPIRDLMHRFPALLVFSLLVALPTPSAWADDRLPRPAGIEPNIGFWLRIYSETDGNSGLLHDSEHLDVVYRVMRFPEGASQRSRDRTIDKQRGRVKAALRLLAAGRRSGLTGDQARILSLWPKGVSNSTLQRASRRIRFQLGQADRFRAGIARQGEWRSQIEKVLKDHGVPRNLVALPHVESSYNAQAYSRVGAAGLWQFTRSTGRRYLRIDSVVDERLDPEKASVAAARLLRDNYRRLDSWPLAITAYNHGAAGMARAKRTLGTDDIATIVKKYKSRAFGFASRNFYAEFLAADQIDRNPERYFEPIRRNRPRAVDRIRIPHFYDAANLAAALRVDLDVLRDHNPALRPSVWNGSKYVPRGYSIRLPAGTVTAPAEQIFASIPASERKSAQHRDRLYKVRRGDSVSKIASRYGVRESKLVSLNNLRSRHRIRVGQVLALPDSAKSSSRRVARRALPADGVYRVRRGDTITGIAARYRLPEADVVAWNGLRNRNQISVGQKLRLAPLEAPVLVARAPESSTTTQSTRADSTRATAREDVPEKPTPQREIAAVTPRPVPDPIAPEPAVELVASVSPERSDPAADAPDEAVELEDPQPLAEPVTDTHDHGTSATAHLVAALDFEVPKRLGLEAELDAEAEIDGSPAADASSDDETTDAYAPAPPDPSQYAVRGDGRIVVQADETLGHYADWLEIRTSRLRSLNRMRRGSTVVIGRTTKLSFTNVDPKTFERRRLEYHRTLQEEFFGAFVVTGTQTYELSHGDTLWELAHERYKLPVWLLRQYNPELNFAALTPGERMIIPSVEPRRG